MARTRTVKPRARVIRPTKKLPCDKWIVGMVDQSVLSTGDPILKFFPHPRIYTSYEAAVRGAEEDYRRYGKPFVVFAKKCVIGPSRPPILKQEYLA